MSDTDTTPGDRMSAPAQRRGELAAFLRSRRERITPEQAGLPTGHRRRTSGLRREEVAQLAGVGVTWYTWLEQGRPINASTQVLDAVARTLMLDPVERQHLFRLAEAPDADPAVVCPKLRPEIQVILDGLTALPASVVTERYDLLAWNAPYAMLFPNVTKLPLSERNNLLQCFIQMPCCQPYENRNHQRAAMVGQLRAAYGKHVGDPAWTGFIKRMEALSPEFAAMWATHDVAQPTAHDKVFRHPLFARLAMTATSFALHTAPGCRMNVYTPSDQATAAAMAYLVSGEAPQTHFPCWEAHQERARQYRLEHEAHRERDLATQQA